MTMRQADGVNDAYAPAKRRRAVREEARPVQRVLDWKTRRLVGWLYEWNTGERMVMWKDGKREDVVYE
jgi:hypothetical protein